MRISLLFILSLSVLLISCFGKADNSGKHTVIDTYLLQDTVFESDISDDWFSNINTDTFDIDTLYLYKFNEAGLNKINLLTSDTKDIIESIVGSYYIMVYWEKSLDEYRTIYPKISFSEVEMELWKNCVNALTFDHLLPSEVLESDWRFPINHIRSMEKVMALYNDASYGDSPLIRVPVYHMALYMYLAPVDEREKILKEIAGLKDELCKKYKNYDNWKFDDIIEE